VAVREAQLGYIGISEGVRLKVINRRAKSKIYLHMIYFQIFTHILINILFKNHYMVVVKYRNE